MLCAVGNLLRVVSKLRRCCRLSICSWHKPIRARTRFRFLLFCGNDEKSCFFLHLTSAAYIYTQQKNIDHHTNLSNNLHNNAPSNDISPCKILTTSASTSSCAAANQCERKSTESAHNETTISSNFRNSAAATNTVAITTAPSTNSHPSDLPVSTIASTTPTHIVSTARKKASSFLHRDYRRKPVLARSQVSFVEDEEMKLWAAFIWRRA